MPEYKLHYFPESGNSYKLALMLTLCGKTFEPIWTDFGSGITRTPEWRNALNPMGEIPVLIENGVCFTQTAPILLQLAEKFSRFQGTTDFERYEILRWLFWDNHKLSGFMAAYRYRRAFMENFNKDVLLFMKSRVDDFLSILEGELQKRPYIIGEHPTVADLSMTGYLAFPPHETGYYLAQTHPAIDAWLQRIASLPGWAAPYDLLPGKRLRCYVSEHATRQHSPRGRARERRAVEQVSARRRASVDRSNCRASFHRACYQLFGRLFVDNGAL